jgi:hypothetical protein
MGVVLVDLKADGQFVHSPDSFSFPQLNFLIYPWRRRSKDDRLHLHWRVLVQQKSKPVVVQCYQSIQRCLRIGQQGQSQNIFFNSITIYRFKKAVEHPLRWAKWWTDRQTTLHIMMVTDPTSDRCALDKAIIGPCKHKVKRVALVMRWTRNILMKAIRFHHSQKLLRRDGRNAVNVQIEVAHFFFK